MSTRERWIVYPLLFLTLGIALRDKIVPPSRFEAESLTCKSLVVSSPNHEPVVLAGGEVHAPRLECDALFVNGPNHEPVVAAGADVNSGAGIIETYTPNGAKQVRLLSTETGGMVQTIGQNGKPILYLGPAGKHYGVFAVVPELGFPIPLTNPLPYPLKLAPAQPPKGPAATPKQPSEKKQETKANAAS